MMLGKVGRAQETNENLRSLRETLAMSSPNALLVDGGVGLGYTDGLDEANEHDEHGGNYDITRLLQRGKGGNRKLA